MFILEVTHFSFSAPHFVPRLVILNICIALCLLYVYVPLEVNCQYTDLVFYLKDWLLNCQICIRLYLNLPCLATSHRRHDAVVSKRTSISVMLSLKIPLFRLVLVVEVLLNIDCQILTWIFAFFTSPLYPYSCICNKLLVVNVKVLASPNPKLFCNWCVVAV